jgi:hypothetical protein
LLGFEVEVAVSVDDQRHQHDGHDELSPTSVRHSRAAQHDACVRARVHCNGD